MSPRDRRALWLGCVAVSAFIALRLVPIVLKRVSALATRAAEDAETLSRGRALLAGKAAIGDSLTRELTSLVQLAPKLIEGSTSAEAQASLTALLSASASRHSLKVVQLAPLPDSAAGVFHRVTVHAVLEGDITGASRFIGAVETSYPVLTIRSLAITARDVIPRPGAPEILRVECDVAGLYLFGHSS